MIELTTPGLQGEQLNHFKEDGTRFAEISDLVSRRID